MTFAPDSDRFYATLASGGKTYLVEGSVAGRRMEVRRENVECPSLSPDGRLAFKKRVNGGFSPSWRFHVLDLATMTETPLTELRSLDDQMEWLDDRRLLYDDQTALGTATTRVIVSAAEPDPHSENDNAEARTTVQPVR